MKKSIIVGSALALSLCLAGPVLAAAPSDVPANHWSFEAVNYLVKAGIVDGYSDGTFRGDKAMSRYEMAQVVYKAMLNESKANIAQKALIDKLAAEYALEMNKIESIDNRLTKVEKNATVKISGQLLEQYKAKNNGKAPNGQYSIKLNASAQVDEDTTVNLRIANPGADSADFRNANALSYGQYTNKVKVDRFFATTKTGATNISIGRQAMDLDQEDVIIDSGFFSYDGVKVTSKIGNVDVDAKRGRFAKGVSTNDFGYLAASKLSNIDIDSIMIGSKSGKLAWDASWARFKNPAGYNQMNYYTSGVKYGFDDKFGIAAEYGKNTTAPTGGNFWFAKAVYGAQSLNAKGKQNLTIGYLHAGVNSINGCFTSFDQPDETSVANGHAWNNIDVAYRYAFSSKMTGKIEYGNVKDSTANKPDSYDFWKAQVIYKF